MLTTAIDSDHRTDRFKFTLQPSVWKISAGSTATKFPIGFDFCVHDAVSLAHSWGGGFDAGQAPGDAGPPQMESNPSNIEPASPADNTSVRPALETTPRRLSEELTLLIASFADRPVRLQDVIAVLHGRAWIMLLLVLSLPFCTPIPLPGVSTPFGFVIALIGFRLSLRQKPWLPQILLNRQIPAGFFPRVLSAARKVVKLLELFLRPRFTWLLDTEFLHHIYGAMILTAGILLLLPLPVPLSNTLPALTVVFLAGAMLERDGGAVIAGLAMFLVMLAFFGALAFGGAGAVHWLTQGIEHLFPADPEGGP